MLKSRWLFIATAVGIALVAGILSHGKINEPDCAVILQELALGNSPKQNRQTNHSHSVTCERDCQVTFFRRHEPDNPAYSKTKVSDSDCNTPEELDLLAQAQMAHWTTYIAWLTGAGVILLIGTLVVTQMTNQAFTEASQRELRAYISIKEVIVPNFSINDRSIDIEINVINAGQTPAQNFRFEVNTILYTHISSIPDEKVLRKLEGNADETLGPNISRTIKTNGRYDHIAPKATDPKLRKMVVGVRGWMKYVDFGNNKRITNIDFVMPESLNASHGHAVTMVPRHAGKNDAT